MNAQHDALEALIHDVRSRCSSLKSAADLLRNAEPKELSELLILMNQQAKILSQTLEDFILEPSCSKR